MLELARQQAEALEAEDLDRFDLLLEERATLLATLEAPSVLGATAHADSADVHALEATAREIVEQDRRNRAVLGDRLSQVRTELPILATSSRVADAYRVAHTAATYVDRSS